MSNILEHRIALQESLTNLKASVESLEEDLARPPLWKTKLDLQEKLADARLLIMVIEKELVDTQ